MIDSGPSPAAELPVDYVTRRVEVCACGGVIAADPEDWRAVAAAIRIHQAKFQHRIWCHLMGYLDPVVDA